MLTAMDRHVKTPIQERTLVSALAGFEAAVSLVDDVHPALAAHDAVIAMACT